MTRVAVFWTGVSAPAAACWRALASLSDVTLRAYIEEPVEAVPELQHTHVLAGLDYSLRFAAEPLNVAELAHDIASYRPDVMIILGWRSEMCRCVAKLPATRDVPKVFAFDMPFSWTPRKILARIILRQYLKRFSAAIVPGESSFRYARWLGFPASAIYPGLISVNTEKYAESYKSRLCLPQSPQRFVFLGRYASCKGIAILVKAYKEYRASVTCPWDLDCYGFGDRKHLLSNVAGICDRGFTQPNSVPAILASSGALVLPSSYDPWPMVLLEAVAAGLPVCCTTACGNAKELLTLGVNGFVSRPGDVHGLAEAMLATQAAAARPDRVADAGFRKASSYSASAWAIRVAKVCTDLTHRKAERKKSKANALLDRKSF